MNKFPPNPVDKQIVEVGPGVFYEYSASRNTWVKLDGFGKTIDLATPLVNGLMSKDDYQKVFGLLVPPPRITLTAEDCNFVFDGGTIGMRSTEDNLFIENELSIFDVDTAGKRVERKEVWKIHENTYGINFRVNLPLLLAEIEKRGHLTYNKTIGPRGKKGLTGDPGLDKLDTGPQGPKGTDGKNEPFSGSLLSEQNIEISEPNRGIIDIKTEEISKEENYLVVTRGVIGNPDLCPDQVRPKNIKSKWIVALDERPIARQLLDECDQARCGGDLCVTTGTTISQIFCSTRLYYLDFTFIEDAIRAQFNELLLELKTTKEKVINTWLTTMMDIFNEQKLAVCCALENCQSRRENDKVRARLEDQRIQAAQTGMQLVVDGTEFKNYVDTNQAPNKTCPPKPPDNIITNRDFEEYAPIMGVLSVSCSTNIDEADAATYELPPGEYIAELTSCCCYADDRVTRDVYETLQKDKTKVSHAFKNHFEKMNPYSGVFVFGYQGQDGPIQIASPDFGEYRDSKDANNAYLGRTIRFTHVGGMIKAFFNKGTGLGNDGTLEIRIKKVGFAMRSMLQPKEDCVTRNIAINCRHNTSESNAAEIELPAGSYTVEIKGCCCGDLFAFPGQPNSIGYSVRIAVEYLSGNAKVIMNPSLGVPHNRLEAQNLYVGQAMSFNHSGGKVKVWSLIPATNAADDGEIAIEIRNKGCVEEPLQYIEKSAQFTVACDMSAERVLFYERAWQSRNCCGAFLKVGGGGWVIMQISAGTDKSCGGGESEQHDCIAEALQHNFYPALAFPSNDGISFLGKPSGMQRFAHNQGFEAMVVDRIRNKNTIQLVGNFVDNLEGILFPVE